MRDYGSIEENDLKQEPNLQMGFELTISVFVCSRLIKIKDELIILERIKHLCLGVQDGAKVQYHFTEGQEPLNKHEC